MAAEMVKVATGEKLQEIDWMKNIEICELVANDPGKAKDVIKAIKKRLNNKNGKVQLFSVKLLEMLMNNCGEHVHKQVVDNEIIPILVKIVKKKTNLPVREKIFLLLDASQTALGGASGKFPQYYNAYYDLVSSGVQFSRQPPVALPEELVQKMEAKDLPVQESFMTKHENGEKKSMTQLIPEPSIIDKASSVLEVLQDVLNALNPKHPVGAADEFVLDLAEQCSFQKQCVMHLVLTSRDEKLVNQAIELNEQLHKVLTQHDALLSIPVMSSQSAYANNEIDEEEDAERLYRRLQKGKACAEDNSNVSIGSFRSIPEDKLHRPLIRPLCIQPSGPDSRPKPQNIQLSDTPIKQNHVVSVPPPPAKHTEREKFFKDRHSDESDLAGHTRDLSLQSNNGSSSNSGSSTDFGERDLFGL